MADRQLTKESQARTLRGWMLGLHATHIIDIGGRLGYFAELKRRGGSATAQEMAAALGLDPWRTEVWCRAACTVGVLQQFPVSRKEVGNGEVSEKSFCA